MFRCLVFSLVISVCAGAAAHSYALTWYAPFVSGGGFSSEALDIVVALEKLMPRNTLQIVQHGDSVNEQFWHQMDPWLQNTLLRLSQTEFPRHGLPRVHVCHSEPGAWQTPRSLWRQAPLEKCGPGAHGGGRGARYIGRTMFETDSVPEGWIPRLDMMTELWVPTQFHKRIYEKAVRKATVHVIQESVNSTMYSDVGSKLDLSKQDFPWINFDPSEFSDSYVFLTVGKWELRKNYEALLESFCAEFTLAEKVILLVVTSPFHESEETVQAKLSALVSDSARVALMPFGVPNMAPLYRSVDAFVLATRGEGWGRPFVEAMASGLPVLATNFSGQTEYMTEHNAFLLEYDLVEVPRPLFFAGHRWAEVRRAHLRHTMRQVAQDPQAAAHRGHAARRAMVERFTPGHIAAQVMQRLEEGSSRGR